MKIVGSCWHEIMQGGNIGQYDERGKNHAERLSKGYLQQNCGGIQESQECDGADADWNGKDGGARFART